MRPKGTRSLMITISMLQRYFQNLTIATRGAKFLVLTCCLHACNGPAESPAAPTAGAPQAASKTGLLVLSQAVAADVSAQPLCNWPFEDGVPLFPVADQPHQLYFYLAPTGISVVRAMADGALCRFMLRTKGQQVEVISSKQFPLCLSNQAHFSIQSNTIRFDGGKYIQFQMIVVPEGQAFRCTLTWASDKELGFTVRHTSLSKTDKAFD